MKRLLIFSLVAIFCLSLAMTASANNPFEKNPYSGRYESDSKAERQPGTAKNVFVVHDENDNVRTDTFTVFYVDNSGQQKRAVSNSTGRAYANFTASTYMRVTLLQIGDVDYSIVGDTYEDISNHNVKEGEVNYFVLRLNRSEKSAYIYHAD